MEKDLEMDWEAWEALAALETWRGKLFLPPGDDLLG